MAAPTTAASFVCGTPRIIRQVGDVCLDIICPSCGDVQLGVASSSMRCTRCNAPILVPEHPVGSRFVNAACDRCGVIGRCAMYAGGRFCAVHAPGGAGL